MSRTVVSPTSGASSPIISRRVLQRRGSASAADPWGSNLELNMNPGRTTSCKLTIMRHRRHYSFGSSQNPHRRGHGAGKGDSAARMSFASASFAPPGSSAGGSGPRPGSPTHGHGLNRRPSAPSAPKPRLSADQIVSLAQQSCNPQSAPSSPRTPGPASFTAIPDDVFLPFALFTTPQPDVPPQSASESPVTDDAVFTTDPRQWSSAQLEFWMKCVDRDTAPDEVWVGLIRRCVLFHSELIWERIKGALGAPPELDPDGFDEDTFTADKPLTFKDCKLDTEFVASPAEEKPPVLEPQPAPDNASESNVSAPGDESPNLSVLTIEPVLMPTAEHDHPPTRPGGQRMHDISEDVREESSENDESSEPADCSPQRDVIQGLRISTPAHLIRTSSMSSVNQLQQLDGYISPPRRSSMSKRVYNVVGERGPGNPLFPTNFARLALGPTLTANNPALRSQMLPPQPAFSNPHSIRASEVLRGRRGKPSWAEGWDPSKHEYAMTTSEGSVGGHRD
ncbi:hypothetical protein EI94DRAFT_1744677 [Lactarius quietus]|nr:hypothetical protein EI94DRAFT_1744677 [Lactarius quietus]